MNLFNTYIIAYPKIIVNKKTKIVTKMSSLGLRKAFNFILEEKANTNATPKNKTKSMARATIAQSLLKIPLFILERAS